MKSETDKPQLRNAHNDNEVSSRIERVVSEDGPDEEQLRRHYLFGSAETKKTNVAGMEGQGMGGQNFGRNNLTPAGNDRGNPPRYAGEHNAYFSRTEPMEEHPEDENFKAPKDEQPGDEDQDPKIPGPQELPEQQKVGEASGTRDDRHPRPEQGYKEGTVDNDGNSGERED